MHSISSFIFHLSSLQFKQRFVLIGLLSSVLLSLQAQKVLVDHDFSRFDGTKWLAPSMLKPFSSITYNQEEGAVLSRNEKQKPIPGRLFDTAFHFRSKPQAIPAGAEEWSVVVTVFASHRDMPLNGYGDGYRCRIVWYGKDGKRLKGKESGYTPSVKAKKLTTTEKRGKIPAGAVTGEVQFGFDTPDLNPGEHAALRRITWTVGTQKEMASLAPHGTLEHVVTLKSVSPFENLRKPVVFTVGNAKFADWKKTAFLLNGKDVTKNVSRKDDVFTLTPAPAFDKGLNILIIRIPGKSGGTTDLELAFFTGKVNPPHKMTLRDDGMALMDGKPYFPLGIACVVKQRRSGGTYDGAFKEISGAGMDFCRHWSSFNAEWSDAKEYLACAKKYNVFISFAPTKIKNDVKVSRIAKGVAAQLDLERVIMWDTGDDTATWIHPEQLLAKYQTIRAIDPWRLTTQADLTISAATPAGKSNYTDYVAASDNFQPEVYPFRSPRQNIFGLPSVIRDMKLIAADIRRAGTVKNVWPLIQYFQSTTGSSGWNRMPTEAELRCTTFLAIIHGAHGIVWYRYASYPKTPNAGYGYSDKEWKAISTLSKQLRSIIDVLEARTGKQTQKVTVLSGPAKDDMKYDSVNTLLKEYNGKKYLFVANSAEKEVTVSFAVPGMKKVRDLFNGKEIPVEDVKFTEELSPFDARVFEIR